MTGKKEKISAQQLFCLLFLSRLSAEIIFPRASAGGAISSLAGMIGSELVRFILALPIILYAFKGENIFAGIRRRSRFLGWFFAIITAVLLTAESLAVLFWSSDFAVKNLLAGGSLWTIFIVASVFAVYAAAMGTEALARAGSIILIAAGIVTIAVIVADIPYMRISGAFGSAAVTLEELVTQLGVRMIRGGDYLIFAALLPSVERRTENSAGKAGLYFALFSLLASVILCGVSVLTLREFYGLTEYPFIASASLSDIAFFKRLDGAAGAVWLLAALFRGGLLLLAAERSITAVSRAAKPRTAEGSSE